MATLRGAEGRRPKKSLCTETRPPLSGPFCKLQFFPEEEVSGVGGSVGGWVRWGSARAPNEPAPTFQQWTVGHRLLQLCHLELGSFVEGLGYQLCLTVANTPFACPKDGWRMQEDATKGCMGGYRAAARCGPNWGMKPSAVDRFMGETFVFSNWFRKFPLQFFFFAVRGVTGEALGGQPVACPVAEPMDLYVAKPRKMPGVLMIIPPTHPCPCPCPCASPSPSPCPCPCPCPCALRNPPELPRHPQPEP